MKEFSREVGLLLQIQYTAGGYWVWKLASELPRQRRSFWGKYTKILNRHLQLVCFVFLIEVPGELDPLSFHKLCVHMHVNETKFERNSSLEYYHMTCIRKTKKCTSYCQGRLSLLCQLPLKIRLPSYFILLNSSAAENSWNKRKW